MTSPDGNCRAAIMMIQDKAQKWVNDVRNGKLHGRSVWFSMKFQLVPRIVYGLCSSTASFNDLSDALRKQYYQILPLRGVVRTANTDSRMIAPGFFGIGLPHLGVEALVAMSNRNGATHAGQPLALSAGIGDIYTAPARILREI